MEVDEHDVPNVRLGQEVEIVRESNPTLRAEGKVMRLDGAMGRRKTQTSDPASRIGMGWN